MSQDMAAVVHLDSAPTPHLLRIPPEIRRIIYSFLLVSPEPLVIVAAPTSTEHSTSPTTMSPHPLSAQLLSTHSLIHTEALPHLYSHNTFDISSRSALSLLVNSFPSQHFSLITSLIVDWDHLQDFSFQLAKPSFQHLLHSLTVLETKHWRNRVRPQSSAFLWRDVKSYERSICTAAQAIIGKAPRLKVLAQREWARPTRSRGEEIMRRNAERAAAAAAAAAAPADATAAPEAGHGTVVLFATNQDHSTGHANATAHPADGNATAPAPAASPSHLQPQQLETRRSNPTKTTLRVKWRFLASVSQLRPDETVVDIDAEVATLTTRRRPEKSGANAAAEEDDDELGARQMALDPI